MARKKNKIKLQEEALSEIPVADTNSESGAEASNVEDYLEEEGTAAASPSRSRHNTP
jgi:hypothetical protein